MKETLHGTVLGDARLEWHGRGVRLTLNHAASQEAYIRWKWEELQDLSPSPLHFHAEGAYPFWRFVTKPHPYLEELWHLFYPNGRKVVPSEIQGLLNTPKTLAVWFMDDGTHDRRTGAILFETQCFSRQEIERLQGCLWNHFHIKTSIHRSGRGRGLRLYVPVRSARRLVTIIKPYVIPAMGYKLPWSP